MSELILPAFVGISNFRDFGGAPVPGGWVAAGRLFRSAHHASATPADLERLQALGLRVLVDLRRPTERNREPSLRPRAFSGAVLVSDKGDLAEAPHMEFLRRGDHDDSSATAFSGDYYRSSPFEPRHLDLFGRAIAALEETGGPMLIHCAAGKDRAGVLAALILSALGVEEDAITADFLATNDHFVTQERLAETRERLRQITGREPSEAVLHGFVGVRAEFLRAMFDEFERRAGGTAAYLSSIGVDEARRERLRAKLIERAPGIVSSAEQARG